MSASILCTFALLASAAAGAEEIPLWPNGAPGSEGMAGRKEVVEQPTPEQNFLKVSNIHNPSITVFLPAPEKATGAALVIAPGGAHRFLAFDHEGTNVARWLNSIGVAGFVLKYRLQREPESPYKVEVHALADAQRAIRLVRSRAAEWHVNPAKVGIMGFSAGGELAAMASTRYDAGKPAAADPVERMSSRPDFQALIYPGKGAEAMTITKDTPPAFMLCADNDRNPATAIAALYGEFKQAGVPVELHIYASGGHGFGMRGGDRPAPVMNTWNLRLADWMMDRGWLPK
jgi:acetyl esterase/lipase